MRSNTDRFVDHAIAHLMSAIEIYNKPDFKARELIFVELITVAWEALFKAKILKDNKGKLSALYIKNGHRYKTSRSGNYMTIELTRAMDLCLVEEQVRANVLEIIEIRDTAIHFINKSKKLPYLVFILGAATLQNFATFLKDWFAINTDQYHFYILPLGFNCAQNVTSLFENTPKEPEGVKRILKNIADTQAALTPNAFQFISAVDITLKSIKKETTTSLPVAIDSSAPHTIVVRETDPLDKYPLTYTELVSEIKKKRPTATQTHIQSAMKQLNIKLDPKYCKPIYRSLKAKTNKEKPTSHGYNREAIPAITALIP